MLDSVGQEIHEGTVCVHVHRQSSSMYFELIIVNELMEQVEGVYGFQDYVRGWKVVKDWKGQWEQRRSHSIMADKLVVTPLSQADVANIVAGNFIGTRSGGN